MPSESMPLLRVKVGPSDEVGIYYTAQDWVKLVYYDHQGDAGEYPASMARALGEAFLKVADFRERVEGL